jgi:riboflavin kinase / FMN adenylyltransferase
MEVSRGLSSLPLTSGDAVVTVGFFDGVHLGHQSVLRRTVEASRSRPLTPVGVTFDRHPREILTPGEEPKLLTSMDRKQALIEQAGIQRLVVLEFTEEFARWPAERFAADVLRRGLHAAHVVVGSNFTFGHRAAGNLAALRAMGPTLGISVEGVPLVKKEGRPVSASSIRKALSEGSLDWPATALGRRYSVDGVVVAGAGRGAGLGFPTANLAVPPRMLLPADGVYAGRASVDGRWHVAALNLGTNPTFGAEPLHLEAYLLDFQGDVRGREMTVEFWTRLRDETRFDSSDELVRQIRADVERTRALVS